MGLLGNLFGSKINYPAIDPNSDAAMRIAEVENELEELADKVSDRLEVVPSENAAYIFIGKPPGVTHVVGVTTHDLYADGWEFLYGFSQVQGRVVVVSVACVLFVTRSTAWTPG